MDENHSETEAQAPNDQPQQELTQESPELKPEPTAEPDNPPEINQTPSTAAYILPPQKYKLKTVLLFSDFLLIILYVYFLLICSIVRDVSAETFSFVSNRMFAFYCVLLITAAAITLVLVFKMTRSARTRFKRNNEVRQDPNLKIWLCGYDWGWPILFAPTAALMAAGGIIGLLVSLIFRDSQAGIVLQNIIGGIVLVFGTLNAAVVIFKIRPVVLGLLAGSFFIVLLILLLHGPETFIRFFKGFRHLGINIEPLGYLLLAYIWSIFLRIIWLRSLFFYWVFVPNRLELQHGLSESNDSVDRDELRLQIDTDDVILRWWNVGIVTFYFPDLDRLPITNVVWGIRKKADYANRIASVKTMQD